MLSYLPDGEQAIQKLPKQFIVDVTFSVVGDHFAQFVKQKILERNEKRQIQQNNIIELDESLAEVFANSSMVNSDR